MGYKMPIVCKDMYIPIEDGDFLSFDEYKAKYGIDLKQYFEFDSNGTILFNPPKYIKMYLVSSTSFSGLFMSILPALGFLSEKTYAHGSSDASTFFGTYDGIENEVLGMNLVIAKETENPTLDDVVISKKYV